MRRGKFQVGVFDISISHIDDWYIDILTLFENIYFNINKDIHIDNDIDKDNLKNINIYIDIDMASPENIDIDIDKDILENIFIDIDKGILI